MRNESERQTRQVGDTAILDWGMRKRICFRRSKNI